MPICFHHNSHSNGPKIGLHVNYFGILSQKFKLEIWIPIFWLKIVELHWITQNSFECIRTNHIYLYIYTLWTTKMFASYILRIDWLTLVLNVSEWSNAYLKTKILPRIGFFFSCIKKNKEKAIVTFTTKKVCNHFFFDFLRQYRPSFGLVFCNTG